MFIQNQLVQADISELDEQMKQDIKLNKLLTAKGNEIPEKYLYLLGEVISNWEKYSLYDLMKLSNDKLDPSHIYFSKAGNKIVGWAAYQTDYDRSTYTEYVSEIKMFSFNENRLNPVLIKDLKQLLDILVEKYPVVSWVAVPDNPANKIYEKVIKTYKGYSQVLKDGNILYVIVRN